MKTIEQLYNEWDAYLGHKSERPYDNGKNSRVRREPDGTIVFHLFETDIAFLDREKLVLQAKGWGTPTTKDRLTQLIRPLGWSIWSEKGQWKFCQSGLAWDHPDRKTAALFKDGITITDQGAFGMSPDESAERKALDKRICEYAKGWVKAWLAGEVPAPSNGDCWGCLVVDSTTGKPVMGTDHLLSHFDEKYYVPSLGAHAMSLRQNKIAPMMQHFMYEWTVENKRPGPSWADYTGREMTKAIKEYLREELLGKHATTRTW